MQKNATVPRARLRGFLSIIRPVNCLVMGFAVVVSEIIALRGKLLPYPAIIGFATGFTLLAAAMVTNDYFDAEVDSINNPGRPIPSGAVSPAEAIALLSGLSIVGLSLAALTGPTGFGIALLAFALMLYYNARGKRTGLPGNLIVSFNTAIPFIFGGAAVGEIPPSLWVFFLLAFTSSLGREITKGIADVEGDSIHGIRTLAVTSGARVAARVSSTMYVASALLSILPVFMRAVSFLYIPFVALCDAGIVFAAYGILRDPSPQRAKMTKNLVLGCMVVGLVAFVAGAFGPTL